MRSFKSNAPLKIIGLIQLSMSARTVDILDKAADRVYEVARAGAILICLQSNSKQNRDEIDEDSEESAGRITIGFEGPPMKTIEKPAADQLQRESLPRSESESTIPVSRFDLIFGRMKGTFTITGDIVNPDHEAWNSERG